MPGKADIRLQALSSRRALSQTERHLKSLQICKEIVALPEYRLAETVMVYLDFRDEVETTRIAQETLRTGKRLVIPLCNQLDTDIIACEIFDLSEDVHSGMMGIREPHPRRLRPVSAKEIDLVLVPGVAFDYHGNRIGFGKGYYDRFLPQLREDVLVIGLAFSCQLVEEIENEKHDYKMSLLITENGVIYRR